MVPKFIEALERDITVPYTLDMTVHFTANNELQS
jgi:hypothetical protein